MPLEIPNLFSSYSIAPRGVIHAGAHYGLEAGVYAQMGFTHGLFFEAHPLVFDALKQRVTAFPGFEAVGSALGSQEGRATLYTETANNGESSSLLKPKLHLAQYPEIQFNGSVEVSVTTLSEYFKTHDSFHYNFLNMDVQGYELEVLKGGMAILHNLDAIFAEVNRAEVYEGCAMIEQIDSFLAPFGFIRRETDWRGDLWGDAFYVRQTGNS